MKSFLLLLIINLSLQVSATNYYISASGNDANNGTSPSTPWKSLNKLNSYFSSLNPGDNVLLNRGSVFYGSITINKSGAAGSPIKISAYGTGPNPVITGFTNVSSWTNLGGNIWESTNPVSALSTCNMVTINGVITPMGRFPNTGFFTYKSHSGNTQFTDNVGLSGSPNWTGAEFAFFITTYSVNRSPITAQSGGTITITPVDGNAVQYDNQRYIIQNDPRTLDTTNEWYYNPSTKKIRVYNSVSPSNVLVSTIDTAIYLEGINYITIDNLQFTGQNSTSIEVSNSKYISITNCNFQQIGEDAIDGRYWGNSTGLFVESCIFNNINNNAVHAQGNHDHAYIGYNTFSNIGLTMGAGRSSDEQSIGLFVAGVGSHVEYNNIFSTGYAGIYFAGDSIVVNNNFVTNALALKTDGGGIYTSNGNKGTSNYGRKVYNNIILNSPNARGIYIDDASSGVEAYNNSISGCAYGIYLHGNHDVSIHNNTVYNNSGAQLLMVSETNEAIRNNNLFSNKFISKDISQLNLLFQSEYDDIPQFGTADSNYYARPIDDNQVIWTSINGIYSYTKRDLANWQAYTSQDTHSHKSPKTITDTSDLKFVYNATSSAVAVSLPYNYMDVTGNIYNGSITLQPYTSAVLIKNGAIYSGSTYFIAASGSDANDGKSSAKAWQTLAKVNATTFQAGDHILFNKGDVFYGSLIIKQSGSSGNPITFGAFGNGANPVITGFTSVSSWTNLGGKIWESTNPVSTLSTCNMVTINGVIAPMGRFPNTGFFTYKSHSGNTQFTDNVGLSGSPNWTGAEFAFFITTYSVNRSRITAQSGGTITITPVDGNAVQYDNQRYIIQNDPRTLDTTNEWYYNPSTKKIRVFNSVSPTNVLVSTVDTAIYLEGINYLSFDRIDFQGQNSTAIEISNSKYISVTNCNFSQQGEDAIDGRYWGNSTGAFIESCNFNDINNNALHLQGNHDHAYVGYNAFFNIGLTMGAGRSSDEQSIGLFVAGVGSHVEYNNIFNTGYAGIYFAGDSIVVNNNFVTNALALKTDGGAIYTSTGGNAGTINYGRKEYNNIIVNSPHAQGIYLDGYSSGVEVYNNTVSGCNIGIYLNASRNVSIHNNTVYNNSLAQILLNSDLNVATRNNNLFSNLFVSKDSSQLCLLVQSAYNDIAQFGLADSNYYARPVNDSLVIWTLINGGPYYTQRTLSGWQAYSGQDAHSKKSPKTITDLNDLNFQYNATSSPVTIPLSYNYMDVTGVTYNGSITLQPYTSTVLIKNGAIRKMTKILPITIASDSGTKPFLKNQMQADGTRIGIAAYPNPFLNSIRVSIIGDAGQYKLMLTDASGRLIWIGDGHKTRGTVNVDINTSTLSKGGYLLNAIQTNKSSVIKLIK